MKGNDNSFYNKNLKEKASYLRKNMTKAEACLWKFVLKSKQIKGYQFRRQRPVLNYIVDFMCKELSLIIEVDGNTHNFNDIQIKDERRQSDLEEAGFTILRFQDREILRNIEGVRYVIEKWINEH